METIDRRSLLLQLEHETRTPLNAIIGFSSIMTDSYGSFSDKDSEEYLSYIERSATSLTAILEKMMIVLRAYSSEQVVEMEQKVRIALNVMVNFPVILKYSTKKDDVEYPERLEILKANALAGQELFEDLKGFAADNASDKEIMAIINSELISCQAEAAQKKEPSMQESNQELIAYNNSFITPSAAVNAHLVQQCLRSYDNQQAYIC